jgi:hypothetical protein
VIEFKGIQGSRASFVTVPWVLQLVVLQAQLKKTAHQGMQLNFKLLCYLCLGVSACESGHTGPNQTSHYKKARVACRSAETHHALHGRKGPLMKHHEH